MLECGQNPSKVPACTVGFLCYHIPSKDSILSLDCEACMNTIKYNKGRYFIYSLIILFYILFIPVSVEMTNFKKIMYVLQVPNL